MFGGQACESSDLSSVPFFLLERARLNTRVLDVNKGLVGFGTLAADAKDSLGETIGG